MARQSRLPVKTFSIGFEEDTHNELPLARLVAEKYSTEHHELVVKPDAIELVPRLVRQFDEPFADASAIPTYLVSEFARRHVTVALSGDGGDEFFGGYREFFQSDARRCFDQIPPGIRRLCSSVASAMPYSFYGKNYLRMMSRPSAIERYFECATYSSYFLRSQVINPEWMFDNGETNMRRVLGDAILDDSHDCVSQAMHYCAAAKLTGDILTKVDRMSMAVSLEVRCPLLDHVLVETANRIPNSWKLSGGKGKLILLRALGDRLPPELLSAPKRGFGLPLRAWMRGPLKPMLHDTLLSRKAQERGIMRPGAAARMLAEHESGRRDNSSFLYVLFVLEQWLTQFQTTAEQPLATPGLSGQLSVTQP
jgi:asparagine synthase (glutamine-hydrolysing)